MDDQTLEGETAPPPPASPPTGKTWAWRIGVFAFGGAVLALVNAILARDAEPVLTRYVRYFARKEHVADDFKAAAALHVDLTPHIEKLTTARQHLARLAERHPKCRIFADSRSLIGLFRNVIAKPNQHELAAALLCPARRPLTLLRADAAAGPRAAHAPASSVRRAG